MNILLPLILTLLVETVIYVFLKPKSLRLLATVVLLNLILNPLMNLFLARMSNPFTYNRLLWLFEVITVVIEATVIIFIVKTSKKKTFLFAIMSNLGSFLMGVVLFVPNSFVSYTGERIAFIILLMIFIILVLVVILFAVSGESKEINSEEETLN